MQVIIPNRCNKCPIGFHSLNFIHKSMKLHKHPRCVLSYWNLIWIRFAINFIKCPGERIEYPFRISIRIFSCFLRFPILHGASAEKNRTQEGKLVPYLSGEITHSRLPLFFLVIDAQVSPSTGRERERTERIMQFRSQSRQQLLIYCSIISLDSSLDRRICNHFNSIRRTFEYLKRHN